MIQPANPGCVVATQTLIRERGLGILYSEPQHLISALRDRAALAALRRNVWEQRGHFTFDAHVEELVAFFRTVLAARGGPGRR